MGLAAIARGVLLELAHEGLSLAARAARARLEAYRRSRETADETAARHFAEDLAWQEQLARVRAQKGPTT